MTSWLLVAVICFGSPDKPSCSTYAVAPFSTQKVCEANAARTSRGYLKAFKRRAKVHYTFCIPFGDYA